LHPFDVATGVRRVAEGRWTADVDAGWFAPTGPNGGYLASPALLVSTELDEEATPDFAAEVGVTGG